MICDEIVYAGVTSSVYYGRHFGPAKNWINVYAIEAKTGRIIWDFQANLAFDTKTKIAVSDGKVFLTAKGIGYAEGFVIALNATNGSLLWKMPCAIFNSIPVTDNGNVFINSDHSLIGFDGINGRVIWNYTLRKFVNAPTTAKGILYAISTDNHLYAINTTDGSHLWDIYTYPGFSGIMVAEDVVYAPSNDGNIYALNSLTGAILWKHDTTPSEFNWANFTVHTTPVYNSGLLFFTSQSRQHIYIRNDFGGDAGHVYTRTSVYALEASTGNKVWNYTVTDVSLGYPVSVDEGVVYTTNSRSILGFNYQNGALIWNYTAAVGILPQTDPVSYDGVLYVGFSGGQLYAMDPTASGLQLHNPYFIIVGGQVIDLALLAVTVTVAVVLLVFVIFYRRKHNSRLSKQSP